MSAPDELLNDPAFQGVDEPERTQTIEEYEASLKARIAALEQERDDWKRRYDERVDDRNVLSREVERLRELIRDFPCNEFYRERSALIRAERLRETGGE